MPFVKDKSNSGQFYHNNDNTVAVECLKLKKVVEIDDVEEQCLEYSSFGIVIGFADSLQFFRSNYLVLKRKCSLMKLYGYFIGGLHEAHNALADVKALKRILEHCHISLKELLSFSFTFSWLTENCNFLNAARRRLSTLSTLINQKILSKGMANKIAKSGLELAHLEAVYNRNTEKHNAITRLLSERFKGKKRVTNNEKVICGLVKWLEMKTKL